MADDVRISGPVHVQSDAKERVAFDLMVRISNNENSKESATREYWLKLYSQCHRAAQGYSLRNILKEE